MRFFYRKIKKVYEYLS